VLTLDLVVLIGDVKTIVLLFPYSLWILVLMFDMLAPAVVRTGLIHFEIYKATSFGFSFSCLFCVILIKVY